MYKVTPEMHPFLQANCYLILQHNRAFAPSLLLRTSIPSLIQVDLVHVKQRHLRLSTQVLIVYEVGLGFIFLLPPVSVTFTNRRVYVILFFARPLGVFFFS